MNEKQKQSEDNGKVLAQEVTTQEVVSTDAETSEEVFEEDLVTDESNPRPRLYSELGSEDLLQVLDQERLVTGHLIQNKLTAGLSHESDSNDTKENKVYENSDEESLEPTITFDSTIIAFKFLDAFGSNKENLCRTEEDFVNVPFISETLVRKFMNRTVTTLISR